MKFQVESQSSVSSSRHKVRLNSPPASLQDWLDEELERRGIDAVIYTRYILSILLQDSYDVDSCQHNAMDEDICSYYFCNDRKLQNQPSRHKHSGRKNTEKFICNHQMGDHEQRKKSAAVECLMSVSEEKYGIEELVEDLCAKLKEFQLENDDIDNNKIKSQQLPDEIIDASPSFEEQAKKYYAAFPALSGKSTDPVVLSISSESNDMIVEKSAWMSGRQHLFDRKDFSPPNEEQEIKVEEVGDDEITENKIHQHKCASKSSDSKLSLIVPKVRSVKTTHSRLSTVFSRNKPAFQVNRSNSKISKHIKQPPTFDVHREVGIKSSNKNSSEKKEDLVPDVHLQKQETSSKFIPVVPTQNEDDEVLAKFIDKFNTENMAAIWDKMFQPPSYFDSVLNLPKWKDTSIFFPNDYPQKYLSVWSTKNDFDDPLIFSNTAKKSWFDGNICINNCCIGNNCLEGLKNENSWATHHQSSFSLLSYCQDSDGPRRFSLTLSDESDDLCSLSQIFHETTSKELDSFPEFEPSNKSTDSNSETSSIQLGDTITTTSLNFMLPSEEYVSLVMCTPSKKSSTDSLLTSERTHFRPIRQESSETDETDLSPDLSKSKYSIKKNENFLLLEDINDEEDTKISDSEENESRDSWSPDMKDCFSTSPAWPACAAHASNNSDSPSTECEAVADILEWSQISEKKGDKVDDLPLEVQCETNPLWACDSSSWHSEISELIHTIASDTNKDCKSPLTVDVGPWTTENQSKTENWSKNSDEEYTSWKCDQTVWPNIISPSVIDAELPTLNSPSKQESEQECTSLWKKDPSTEDTIKSCEVVEALRVEIKEETKQLFDDIHDMVNKEDMDEEVFIDLGQDVDDEALCEWMLNVDLSSDSKAATTTLPQLEPNMLDDMLGDGSALACVSPDDIIYSSELEAEWIKDSQNFNVQVPKIRDRSIWKHLPRPCSFFMEGTCRRSDCKFSHDLSKITCRFWEEGACFKGITCPFLHGYPLSPDDSDHETSAPYQINLQHEDDFPDLPSYKNKETSPETVEDKSKNKKTNHRVKKKRQKKSCGQAQQIKNK